jgi:putative hydrolase of HD superfamily
MKDEDLTSPNTINKNNDLTDQTSDPVVDFLFEVGILAKTPRSWSAFLGSGQQSVAEHINRVVYIGFCLGHLNGKVDIGRIIQMCQFHDVTESRISDLNYVHQKYTESLEEKAEQDLIKSLSFGDKIGELLMEYHEKKTYESLLAKDADNLELLLSLKEQIDIGNERAKTWVSPTIGRLKTEEAKSLAEKILEIDSDHWWFGDKNDSWWVNRNKK